jgi:diacylglycerol O-acyltransferase
VVVHAAIQRASSNDLMELVAGGGSAPMQVAAVITLDAALDLPAVRSALAARVPGVPRLRQRLVRTPFGCGRPIWVDDPRFDIDDHVRALRCADPGDEAALLEVAADAVREPLPRNRPLWSAVLVTGLASGGAALVLVVHHVLADGIAGLALLARLVDGAPAVASAPFPAPPPSRWDLFADATASRWQALFAVPSGLRLLRDAVAELRMGQTSRPPRCSLNQPTGSSRRLAVVRADLGRVTAVAHEHGATVNDVLLTAVGGALAAVLRHRGEPADSFVASVPVSGRRVASSTQLGNQVGVMPVEVPARGEPTTRLHAVARATRAHRGQARGASAALLAPVWRVVARLGAFRWCVDHQHLVTTFVTNVRGPATGLSFLGARISGITAVTTTTGNVTVAFAALSYAGTLAVTVVADAERCPDLPVLAAALREQLDELTSSQPVAACANRA